MTIYVRLLVWSICVVLLVAVGCSRDDGNSESELSDACRDIDRELDVGFYTNYEPISHNAGAEPGSEGFDVHMGLEADLLEALEAMGDLNLVLNRRGISEWSDIWLRSASPEFDLVGGGITSLDSRTYNIDGQQVVRFTDGHLMFQQSILVTADNQERITGVNDLTRNYRVGVSRDTTGESDLLRLTGITNADGVLVAKTVVETPQGNFTADGTDNFVITAASVTPNSLDSRTRIYPPAADMPEVMYVGEGTDYTDAEKALQDGEVDALSRDHLSNQLAAQRSDGQFVVTTPQSSGEIGAFTVAVEDTDLAECLNERLGWLTDERRIGYSEWASDHSVFMTRSNQWNTGSR